MDAGKLGDQKLEEFTNDAYRNLTAVSETRNSYLDKIQFMISEHVFLISILHHGTPEIVTLLMK